MEEDEIGKRMREAAREERRRAKEAEYKQARREKEFDIVERITELILDDTYEGYIWTRERDERDDTELYAILFGNTLDLCFQHEDMIDVVIAMTDEELKTVILQATKNVDRQILEEQ